jgi:hypothetical protein
VNALTTCFIGQVYNVPRVTYVQPLASNNPQLNIYLGAAAWFCRQLYLEHEKRDSTVQFESLSLRVSGTLISKS